VTQGPTAPAAIKVGSTAPEFDVSTTAGAVDLKTMQAPVLLEVFATWCPHCQHEVPLLSQLYRNDGRRAAFIAVSGSPLGMDHESPSSLEDVERFGQLLGVQYPIAYDADMDVAKKYLQNGYPTIVFVNKNRRVVAIESGEVPYAKLQADLNKAIGGHA
jgi:thiol-disulfide isomerase/thioredoxin